MPKGLLITISVWTVVVMMPARAQEGRFNFSAGGGVGVPLNPTADFAGVGGNFITGVGYNVSEHSAVIGQYMWHGLPPSLSAKTQLEGGGASSNLNALTVNYRYIRQFNPTFGYYLIAGGGWYYRHSKVSLQTPPNQAIVCQPIYNWYGYSCSAGYVTSTVSASAGTSALGVNGGAGFTIRLSDSRWQFFIESRYNYAGSAHVSTQVSPVTFGIMYH
jgi:Outer membrane protein beta-barrel domain